MITNTQHLDMLVSPARTIVGRVELFEGSTLLQTFSHTDALSNFTLSRAGEKKFFGFGVSQEIEVKLVDKDRAINITEGNILKVGFGVNEDYVYPTPLFYVNKITRNENTNEITIKAYDLIYQAKSRTFADLGIEAPYNLNDIAEACAVLLGASGTIGADEELFFLEYESGANLEGSETIRDVMDDIAEITGTFYFVDAANNLVFRRLEQTANINLEISKADYFTLDNSDNKVLGSIVSATELGDNIEAVIYNFASGVEVPLSDVNPNGQEMEVYLTARDLVNPFNRDGTVNKYGVARTVKQGGKTFILNGTATATSGRNDFRNAADKFILEAGKTYVLEVKVINSDTHGRVDGYVTKNDTDYTAITGVSCLDGKKEFVMDETIECFIGINPIEGVTYDNVEVSITVREKRTDFSEATVSVIGDDGMFLNYQANPDGTIDGVVTQSTQYMTFITNDTEVDVNVKYVVNNTLDGVTQYIRDNAFLDLREDRASLINELLAAMKGLTLTQFTCKWRGNYLLEPGDKIAIADKRNKYITSYLLDDKYTYNGGFAADTTWEYSESSGKTAANPSNIGDALKQTFAKVDKVNKQIDLVVSDVEGYGEDISSIQMTTNNITASVSDLNKDIGSLSKKVDATLTSEDVQIAIQQELVNGVDKVITTTGFTFNDEGLMVSKTGSEMTTQITEDGMTVFRNSGEVLTADNTGVKAENLTATTYLIVGINSRFENYDNGNRTGCFWIGG